MKHVLRTGNESVMEFLSTAPDLSKIFRNYYDKDFIKISNEVMGDVIYFSENELLCKKLGITTTMGGPVDVVNGESIEAKSRMFKHVEEVDPSDDKVDKEAMLKAALPKLIMEIKGEISRGCIPYAIVPCGLARRPDGKAVMPFIFRAAYK